MSIDGILNIDKPLGQTSFDVVAQVRRLSSQRRVGHAGTLDPAASGVLPVCLGRGCRMIEFMAQFPKTYLAQVELGVATDTYDAQGSITQSLDPSWVTRGQLEAVIVAFRGPIPQTPPSYSALRHQGQRLYRLARAGVPVRPKPRRVDIFRLEIVDWQPPVVTLEVECGKGTYIRSLAHDMGQALGCGAHLRGLVRLKSSGFSLDDSVTLPQLEAAFRHGCWQNLLYPPDQVLLAWDAIIVGEENERGLAKGRPLSLARPESSPPHRRCRAYSLDGRFLAVLCLQAEAEFWHPDKVFCDQPLT